MASKIANDDGSNLRMVFQPHIPPLDSFCRGAGYQKITSTQRGLTAAPATRARPQFKSSGGIAPEGAELAHRPVIEPPASTWRPSPALFIQAGAVEPDGYLVAGRDVTLSRARAR